MGESKELPRPVRVPTAEVTEPEKRDGTEMRELWCACCSATLKPSRHVMHCAQCGLLHAAVDEDIAWYWEERKRLRLSTAPGPSEPFDRRALLDAQESYRKMKANVAKSIALHPGISQEQLVAAVRKIKAERDQLAEVAGNLTGLRPSFVEEICDDLAKFRYTLDRAYKESGDSKKMLKACMLERDALLKQLHQTCKTAGDREALRSRICEQLGLPLSMTDEELAAAAGAERKERIAEIDALVDAINAACGPLDMPVSSALATKVQAVQELGLLAKQAGADSTTRELISELASLTSERDGWRAMYESRMRAVT